MPMARNQTPVADYKLDINKTLPVLITELMDTVREQLDQRADIFPYDMESFRTSKGTTAYLNLKLKLAKQEAMDPHGYFSCELVADPWTAGGMGADLFLIVQPLTAYQMRSGPAPALTRLLLQPMLELSLNLGTLECKQYGLIPAFVNYNPDSFSITRKTSFSQLHTLFDALLLDQYQKKLDKIAQLETYLSQFSESEQERVVRLLTELFIPLKAEFKRSEYGIDPADLIDSKWYDQLRQVVGNIKQNALATAGI